MGNNITIQSSGDFSGKSFFQTVVILMVALTMMLVFMVEVYIVSPLIAGYYIITLFCL